ncbi:hypothetical protein HUK80_00235 [Flavobacterium sp. MAH-1]|uniref:Lipoprotein n=1 Tax=Flavobacterium agri TaxID=2743471 RepID=A0A7Y8XZS3_9FLAO|nr:hypothetical protein [Flavobacterium agri]NUY79304.1 hypothetical protein [Flavobacterium agri]NYA69328.1 hypothetical protein [Flavobacterium agri]
MKTQIFVALAALSLASCSQKSEKTETASEKDTVSIEKPEEVQIKECYAFVQQKDTISLSIDQDGADVKGNLRFKNYEKDSSSGEVEGEYSGDTLKLAYTFQSEGTTSKREMRFLRSGNSLIMGIGDMQDKDGTLSFTKPLAVKYDKSLVLVKTECAD